MSNSNLIDGARALTLKLDMYAFSKLAALVEQERIAAKELLKSANCPKGLVENVQSYLKDMEYLTNRLDEAHNEYTSQFAATEVLPDFAKFSMVNGKTVLEPIEPKPNKPYINTPKPVYHNKKLKDYAE